MAAAGLEIKPGDLVRVKLLASRTLPDRRRMNGLPREQFEGKVVNKPTVGLRFVLECDDGEFITSPIEKFGGGMFTTKNSTYSIEFLNQEPKEK